jgi:hypothetical protein
MRWFSACRSRSRSLAAAEKRPPPQKNPISSLSLFLKKKRRDAKALAEKIAKKAAEDAKK